MKKVWGAVQWYAKKKVNMENKIYMFCYEDSIVRIEILFHKGSSHKKVRMPINDTPVSVLLFCSGICDIDVKFVLSIQNTII